jgi:hypothetical protein
MSKNNIKETNILKGLQTQLERASGEFEALKLQQNEIIAHIQYKKKQVDDLKNKIKQFESTKNKPLIVSEHAILRYLERVEGLDINSVIEKIATPDIKKMAEVLGNGTFPSGNNFSVKVNNNIAITVLV